MPPKSCGLDRSCEVWQLLHSVAWRHFLVLPINTVPLCLLAWRTWSSLVSSLCRPLARSGAERQSSGRWKGLCSHFSTPIPSLFIGYRDTTSLCRCRMVITVMHVSVDILDLFTWSRKRVIWWRTLLISDIVLLPSHTAMSTIKHLSWDCAKKRESARFYFISQQEQY